MKDDLSKLNGISTEFIGILIEAFVALALGLTIALAFKWDITLISLVLAPILILGGIFMSRQAEYLPVTSEGNLTN